MVAAFRLIGLLFLACFEHLKDGLAWPALAVALLLGWRRFRVWWLLVPTALLAGYASHIYAYATGETKIAGAMGNLAFELMVFAALSLAGYAAGRFISSRRPAPLSQKPGQEPGD